MVSSRRSGKRHRSWGTQNKMLSSLVLAFVVAIVVVRVVLSLLFVACVCCHCCGSCCFGWNLVVHCGETNGELLLSVLFEIVCGPWGRPSNCYGIASYFQLRDPWTVPWIGAVDHWNDETGHRRRSQRTRRSRRAKRRGSGFLVLECCGPSPAPDHLLVS